MRIFCLLTLVTSLFCVSAATAQYSMGRPQTRKPPAMGTTSNGSLTPEEGKGFQDAMNRLPSKDRKRLTKAIKHMDPAERRQFAGIVKQELAKRQVAANAQAQAVRRLR